MNEPTIEKITSELAERLIGKKFGKVFPFSKSKFAIDFRLSTGEYLYVSVEPNSPRVYLIKRKLKELNKSLIQQSFAAFLRKYIANAVVKKVTKLPDERVLQITLTAINEYGEAKVYQFIIQLTGQSSNLFLLDENSMILNPLRETVGDGQTINTKYSPPLKSKANKSNNLVLFPKGDAATLSEALDAHYKEQEEQDTFNQLVSNAKSSIQTKFKKNKRLYKNLQKDLDNHGKPKKWKRFGDLLLANVATAKRENNSIIVVDYFDENTPEIKIECDNNFSITEAAEKFFKKYAKARNAETEISNRLKLVEAEIDGLKKKKAELNLAVENKDLSFIKSFVIQKQIQVVNKISKKNNNSSVAREFVSSDGIDILVGKRSKDNDYLTFRVAKSLDTWLHAADYPGSHVVIRANKKEISPETLVEAAQLAAFYSKAKKEAKVAVHYTKKKFINKPKGAAPGLVSLSSFKTIVVEPKITVKKKDEQ